MKNNYKFLFLVPVVMLAFLFGCRKPATTAAAQKALFGLHLHTYIDTNLVSTSLTDTVQYGQWFQDHNQRWMNITNASIYISNIGIHSSTTGQWYNLQGSVMLKRIENEQYAIDSVPVDNYDNVRFTIGLGSALNNNPPSYYSGSGIPVADSVLTASENIMYANPGYYFLYLTGYAGTTSGHSNPVPFSYQLAGDTFQVSPPSASQNNIFPIIPNVPGAQYVHIIFDYGKLLQSFPITAPVNLKTTTPTPQLDSIPGIIRYECATPGKDC